VSVASSKIWTPSANGITLSADWIRKIPFIKKHGLNFGNLIALAKKFWYYHSVVDDDMILLLNENDPDLILMFDEECCCDIPCNVCPNWWPWAYGNGGVTATYSMPDFFLSSDCGDDPIPDCYTGYGYDGSPLTGFYHLPFSHQTFNGCVYTCFWICDFYTQGIGVNGYIELPSKYSTVGCDGSLFASSMTFAINLYLCAPSGNLEWDAWFKPNGFETGCVFPEFCYGGTAWPSQWHEGNEAGKSPCDTDCLESYDGYFDKVCGPPERSVLQGQAPTNIYDEDPCYTGNVPCSSLDDPPNPCNAILYLEYGGSVLIQPDTS